MADFPSLAGTRGLKIAATAALGVALLALTTRFIEVVAELASLALLAPGHSGFALLTMLGYFWTVSFLFIPFAAGVLLSLWRVAPIAAELRLTHVVTRSLLAAVVGGAAVFVVMLIIGLAQGAYTESPFGASFGSLAGELTDAAGAALGSAAAGALRATLQQAPVVVLAGVLVWIWLGRHPVRERVVSARGQV